MRASSDTHDAVSNYPPVAAVVVFHHGAEKLVVPGLGTDLSRNGMALYAGLILKAGDPIEVEFQIPSRLRVACIIRNRAGYCFGLEFLAVLPS